MDTQDIKNKMRVSIMNNLVMFSGNQLTPSIIGAITGNILDSIAHVLIKEGIFKESVMTDAEKKSLISYIRSALEPVMIEMRDAVGDGMNTQERIRVSYAQLIERQIDGFREAVTKIEKIILDYEGK